MRKILFTVLASSALLVAVPTAALAHNGRSHHPKRHHHARVRHELFVSKHDSGAGNPGTAGTAGNPGDANQPTAGTVTSFANNMLTITLTNGNTVTGEVTNDTEIKCEGPGTMGDGEHGDRVSDHGPGGGDNGDNGDQGDQGDQGDDNSTNAMCTITPGMAVQRAELTIDGSGTFWSEVELVSASTSTAPTS